MQHPIMVVLRGDSMSADEAAWASVADAAEKALTLPGLTPASRSDLLEVRAGARIAAGLPSELRQPHVGVQMPA